MLLCLLLIQTACIFTGFSSNALSSSYHWIKRKERPGPRDNAPIVVVNHVSYIDPIFFFYESSPTIVACESHDYMPFVGVIIRAMKVIYVNQFSYQSRKQAVNEIKDLLAFWLFSSFLH